MARQKRFSLLIFRPVNCRRFSVKKYSKLLVSRSLLSFSLSLSPPASFVPIEASVEFAKARKLKRNGWKGREKIISLPCYTCMCSLYSRICIGAHSQTQFLSNVRRCTYEELKKWQTVNMLSQQQVVACSWKCCRLSAFFFWLFVGLFWHFLPLDESVRDLSKRERDRERKERNGKGDCTFH